VEILRRLIEQRRVPCLNVAGSEIVSIKRMADSIGRRLGRAAPFVLSDRQRRFDLVADITLLERVLAPAFTPFEAGIERTVAAAGRSAAR
jgi:UDP-glucose 4-epimerase